MYDHSYTMTLNNSVRNRIEELAAKRILLFDGAMGAMIQAYRTPSGKPLNEDDFRGEPFRDHPLPIKGCGEVLCITRPDIVTEIHEAYMEAGADFSETCSFNANAISLADFGLAGYAYEFSLAAARLARAAADKFSSPAKPRFVIGSMGPTSKSASISPDLNDPGKRAVTWDELEAAYYDNARGLLDGGSDIILIETIIDSLNAKAAVYAVLRLANERGIELPMIISASIMEKGGRILSGQTLEAFCVSMAHANPLAIGLNCSFGAEKMKPHIAAVSAAVPFLICAYPNAGLPNQDGLYDQDPETMAGHIEDYLREGLVNIIGGCCGTTPAHIAAIAARIPNYDPRPKVPGEATENTPGNIPLAGLEVLEFNKDDLGTLEDLGENGDFIEFIKKGEYDDAVDLAREMTGDGPIKITADKLSPDGLSNFLNYALPFPDLARLPLVLAGSSWAVIEAGLKCLPGKGLVSMGGIRAGDEEFNRLEKLIRPYGAVLIDSI